MWESLKKQEQRIRTLNILTLWNMTVYIGETIEKSLEMCYVYTYIIHFCILGMLDLIIYVLPNEWTRFVDIIGKTNDAWRSIILM